MNMSFSFPSNSINRLHNPDFFHLETINFHSNIVKACPSNRRSIITFSSRNQGGDDDDYAAATPAGSLRRLLRAPGLHLGPACFDALSAKLVQQAGYDFCFTTGEFLSN